MDFWKIENSENVVEIKWSHNCFEDYKNLALDFYDCGYKTFEEMEYYTKKGKFPTEQRDVKDEDDFEEEPERPQGRRKVEPRVEPIEEPEEVEQPAPVRRRRIG